MKDKDLKSLEIDLGGFLMFEQMRENIQTLQPYRMDAEAFCEYKMSRFI